MNDVHEYLLSPKLKKKLMRVWRRSKIGGEFEDYYHNYIVHILAGRGAKQTMDQYAIDELRKKLGRKGQKKVQEVELPLSLEVAKPADLLLRDCERLFKGKLRVVFSLKYIYGYTNKEIGDMVGRSEAAICLEDGDISDILKEEGYK
jgi:DNA-directed RNA polymerase specialized sigma24 family protein